MQPQRDTMTDSLADIIHIIRLGGKSGTLTVERGEANTLEEGFIAFADGRILEAKAGRSSGQQAFNYLNAWTTCRFSFADYATSDGTVPYQSAHFSPSGEKFPQKDVSVPKTGQLATSPLTPQSNDMSLNNRGSVVAFSLPARSRAGEIALQQLDRVHISRLQKRLLLLVNGQRTLSELARLIVRSPEETQILLEELERAGFVK
ncbi:MAG: DUF4388 domain-containing protein [Ktedonobacteraceae bacterium]|nr:DUF4388 domain-containing protein [Ktedonobacteraceae bacterium]